jgi:hypothetical protein
LKCPAPVPNSVAIAAEPWVSATRQRCRISEEDLMTTRTALFALLAAWGVGTCTAFPTMAEDSPTETTSETSKSGEGLTDRVWTQTDDGGLPGIMRIFLSDGTLVQDSCWETHRLSNWSMVSDTSLRWNEDGMDIDADIVSLTDAELVLRLNLRGGAVEEHYVTATVPYLCPDMPKG